MKTNNSVVIKKEWGQIMAEAFRFFLQHTSIVFDGEAQTARVDYRGPHGWNLSLHSSYNEVIDTSFETDEGNGGY